MDYDEINFETESEARYTFCIAEKKFHECLRITIKTEKIKQRGNRYLEFPAQHLTFVCAVNDKCRRVKRVIFVPLKLGTVFIDHVFLVSPQLLTSAILGVYFFINSSAIFKVVDDRTT